MVDTEGKEVTERREAFFYGGRLSRRGPGKTVRLATGALMVFLAGCVSEFPESFFESDAALLLANTGDANESFTATSPNTYSSLALWFKADALSLTDGSAVSTWPDSSGLGNDATAPTAAEEPVFRQSSLNGMPAIQFDGVDDTLISSDVDFETYTFIVVSRFSRPYGGAQYRMDPITKMSGGRSTALYFEWWSDGLSYITSRNSLDGSAEFFIRTRVNKDEWYLKAATYDGVASHLFVNGQLKISSGIHVGAIFDLATGFHIVSKNAFGHIFTGDIAEVIMYKQALTDSQRVRVECHLALKYNISVSQSCIP
tara:strand:- start:100069 stop:101007 length:939 start_codon:yes stop_codon:yes gene_type:complete